MKYICIIKYSILFIYFLIGKKNVLQQINKLFDYEINESLDRHKLEVMVRFWDFSNPSSIIKISYPVRLGALYYFRNREHETHNRRDRRQIIAGKIVGRKL